MGGGGGCKTKSLPWWEYGYFLELHISNLYTKQSCTLQNENKAFFETVSPGVNYLFI